jgi:hypothetical protein
MKKLITIYLLSCAIGGIVFARGIGANSAEAESAVLEELTALTRASLEEWYGKSDPTAFAQRFADKGTYFDPWTGGRVDDGAIKEYLMPFKGQVPKLDFEIINPRVDLYGDTALLTFVCNAIDPESGGVTPWNVIEVFIRSKGDWKRIHANWNYTHAVPAS